MEMLMIAPEGPEGPRGPSHPLDPGHELPTHPPRPELPPHTAPEEVPEKEPPSPEPARRELPDVHDPWPHEVGDPPAPGAPPEIED